MRAHRLLPVLLLLGASGSSCATVLGTAASPLTGGVDAVTVYVGQHEWYWVPFAFVGGTLGAPFVAFYNGINYDAENLDEGGLYWDDFARNFRPYRMLRADT